MRSERCPVEILEGDPEIGAAIERYRLAEGLGLRMLDGPIGDLDYRTATLCAAVASEVAWIHAAIRRGAS